LPLVASNRQKEKKSFGQPSCAAIKKRGECNYIHV
jgi:hypothetical protein